MTSASSASSRAYTSSTGTPSPLMGRSGWPVLRRTSLCSIRVFAAARMFALDRRFSRSGRERTSAAAALGRPGGGLGEAVLELAEGRVARAPEAVDRLVVVADHHDVVGLVGPAADELEEQDLGHVRVLELVDQDVAELALVAKKKVGPVAQELDRAELLLAEVDQAALVERPLVERVYLRLLGQAEELERRRVAQVRLLERGGGLLLVGREVVPADGLADARGLPPGNAIGPLLACLERVAELRADFADRPELVAGAADADRLGRRVPVAELRLEGLAPAIDVRRVFGRRHELVLGPADHRRKAAQDRARVEREIVVQEAAHLRAQLEQEELLSDLVEDAAAIGQAELGAVRGQEAVAETVEVVDPQAGGALDTDGRLEAVAELGRGPDVVRQDEDVLGGEVRVLVEKVADALDDDGRLARPGTGEDHQRPVAPLDGRALLGGQPVAVGLCRSACLPWSPRLVLAGRLEVTAGVIAPCIQPRRAELERESEAWARERTEFDRKLRYSASAYALRSRDVTGAAQKRPR